MTNPSPGALARAVFLLAVAFPVPFRRVAESRRPQERQEGRRRARAQVRVQQLHVDNNEGCAVADYDRDGKPDVSAGEFWYAGPDFKTKRPLRKLEPFGKELPHQLRRTRVRRER